MDNRKQINGYEIHYSELLNSNIAGRRNNKSKNKSNYENRGLFVEDVFEEETKYFNPTSWID